MDWKYFRAAVLSIYQFSPIVAGIAVGAIWQVLVMFGLHWGLSRLLSTILVY